MDKSDNAKTWNEWKTFKTITLQTHEAYPEIGLLTLNRPDKLNSVNAHMVNDINECLDLLMRSFDCRVLVVAGAGKLFCAGLDLNMMTPDSSKEAEYEWQNFQDRIKLIWQRQHEISSMFKKLRKIPQPVIVAAHGAAVGIGMAMANASDILVASKKTRFINAFIKIGASGADCGSSYFLPRTLGFHRSNELLYSGRDLMAEEAYQWGYVNRLVENNEDVVKEAVAFAAEMMLTKSTLGLRLTKEAINLNMDCPGLDEVIGFEDRTQLLTGESTDMQEGISAFFEKRKPKYSTR
jgi:enoyl-CoA hydratase